MKTVFFAAMLLLALFVATNAYPSYFPLDSMDEQQAEIQEMIKEMRSILETQRALLHGLPPDKRDELTRENSRLIEKTDQMIARSEVRREKKAPPYSYHYGLASFLRSTMQRKS
ncbi:MAG: hypothetical protein A4E57_03312 [Syntrophorhabdaceae bacterium PtaU1.Bin034]|nr:MAG: hypothetical protein A4E57_03312 [Syntrophorhabdaceae bacterium PtaU1.Bin034]